MIKNLVAAIRSLFSTPVPPEPEPMTDHDRAVVAAVNRLMSDDELRRRLLHILADAANGGSFAEAVHRAIRELGLENNSDTRLRVANLIADHTIDRASAHDVVAELMEVKP